MAGRCREWEINAVCAKSARYMMIIFSKEKRRTSGATPKRLCRAHVAVCHFFLFLKRKKLDSSSADCRRHFTTSRGMSSWSPYILAPPTTTLSHPALGSYPNLSGHQPAQPAGWLELISQLRYFYPPSPAGSNFSLFLPSCSGKKKNFISIQFFHWQPSHTHTHKKGVSDGIYNLLVLIHQPPVVQL